MVDANAKRSENRIKDKRRAPELRSWDTVIFECFEIFYSSILQLHFFFVWFSHGIMSNNSNSNSDLPILTHQVVDKSQVGISSKNTKYSHSRNPSQNIMKRFHRSSRNGCWPLSITSFWIQSTFWTNSLPTVKPNSLNSIRNCKRLSRRCLSWSQRYVHSATVQKLSSH